LVVSLIGGLTFFLLKQLESRQLKVKKGAPSKPG